MVPYRDSRQAGRQSGKDISIVGDVLWRIKVSNTYSNTYDDHLNVTKDLRETKDDIEDDRH